MNNQYDRAMREQWDSSLMGAQFWDYVTRSFQERARNEGQALTGQLPHQSSTQSPSKSHVQTTVTSSTEKSPKKQKSRLELSRLASFNSTRLRNTIHPSPPRTHTPTSPEKSPETSQKTSKKGSLRLPRLPSFTSSSLKRRGPILASTTGIVELQKPTRPSILSPSTFLPPESPPTFFPPEYPIPPITTAPRPAFRSLYRGPSAANLDIVPPIAPEDPYPFSTISPNRRSIISFQEWLERPSDPLPESVPTPRPAHSSQINLMAYLNDGGTWDNIPRTKPVLELNMLCDARKASPNDRVGPEDDQIIYKGTMSDAAIEANVPVANETATDSLGAHHSPKEPEGEVKIRITIPSEENLRPLVEFRNLRVLRLTGMFKSYQSVIWQAVWLNSQLTTLELEMTVGLEIKKPGPRGWKPITDGWVMNVKSFGAPVYHGEHGNGEISSKIGYGEYLDKFCIEKARLLAGATRFPVPRYLPVKHLTLAGFAVDGDAFGMWFRNLEEVHFKKDCIDCGFWLSRAQRDVRVRHSNNLGVARGNDGPSGASSMEELDEDELAELTAAVGGLGVSRM
ncbi:uncharacterized protein N7487_007154 [Penicillium crustosum]|uniref:uncharacterized protein n=1 Tax=Penicillium crustosum TaxID=36656 RepID=UPI002393F5FD|nr:uncharacterized protein N7487_007154 [Penicillium crustosum]KAJ5401258.1 hypothetical protein N7487_007154 [Penicillium crustosum]